MADSIATASTTGQLITVVAPSQRSTVTSLDVFQRVGTCFHLVHGPYDGEVGADGLSAHHHEGDDTTPIGLFAIQSTMYGIDANPGVAYRYHQLVCGDWWDEQSSSALYNHFVHVPCDTTPPFSGDSEPLWEVTPQYDYFAVIEYNRSPGRAGSRFSDIPPRLHRRTDDGLRRDSQGRPPTGPAISSTRAASDDLHRPLVQLLAR